MRSNSDRGTHWVLLIIGLFGLLWNLMGVMNFLWQMSLSADGLATLSEAQRAIIDGRHCG